MRSPMALLCLAVFIHHYFGVTGDPYPDCNSLVGDCRGMKSGHATCCKRYNDNGTPKDGLPPQYTTDYVTCQFDPISDRKTWMGYKCPGEPSRWNRCLQRMDGVASCRNLLNVSKHDLKINR